MPAALLRRHLVATVVVLGLCSPSVAHASGSGVAALDPGETGVGILIGVAIPPVVLLTYAIAGVEYHELLVPAPIAWCQLAVSTAALIGAAAYEGPSYAVDPILGISGFMLAIHALMSLIW